MKGINVKKVYENMVRRIVADRLLNDSETEMVMRFKRVVKAFGNRGAHITLPKYLIGKEVIVTFKGKFESIEEITKRL